MKMSSIEDYIEDKQTASHGSELASVENSEFSSREYADKVDQLGEVANKKSSSLGTKIRGVKTKRPPNQIESTTLLQS